MQVLGGVDSAFLHLETPQTPMHIASAHVLEPPAGTGDFVADLRRRMSRRLHLAPVLTRRLAPMPLQFANPAWVEDERVDLEHHVRRVTLPAPGTPAQFEDCIARLHAELLDRDRPLWQMVVIDGLQSGQLGFYFKAHHAVVDGQAGIQLAKALFDLTPAPGSPPRGRRPERRPAEHPAAGELAAAALAHDAGQIVKLVRHLPDIVRTAARVFGPAGPPDDGSGRGGGRRPGPLSQNFAFGPRTPLNVPITSERGFAALSLPLDDLRRLAAIHETTLNDVVLALCSGALRRYLALHGGIPGKPLTAAMPISLRAAGNADYTTQATMPLVNLQTHVADPIRRLHAIRDAAAAVKSLVRRAQGVVPMDFPSIGLPWLLQAAAALYGRTGIAAAMPPIANVVISNVPGPQVPLYVAGARLLTYWPVSIVEHGVGVNVTVLSYAGTMGFGIVTARAAVPEARDLSHALAAAYDELRDLSRPRTTGPGIRTRRARDERSP
jgi:WS/DGAT/MGAT family acyltransferase